MVTVGVAPLIGLDTGHLMGSKMADCCKMAAEQTAWCPDMVTLKTLWKTTWPPLCRVCLSSVHLLCQTIAKRDRLSFIPTLGLSLNQWEGPELTRNPGESLLTWPEASCLPAVWCGEPVLIYQWGCDKYIILKEYRTGIWDWIHNSWSHTYT